MPTTLTPEIITAAIDGFEAQKHRIDTQIAELRAILSPGPAETAATPEAPAPKRKKFSAAARKRMKDAQQRRWARIRGEGEPPAPATPEAPKKKRRISEEGMKRIIAATKRRWRLAKAAKAKTPAAKKTAIKESAVKAPTAKAAKRAPKKTVAKKAVPQSSSAVTETAGQ